MEMAMAAAHDWRVQAGADSTTEILEDADGVLRVVGLIDTDGFQGI